MTAVQKRRRSSWITSRWAATITPRISRSAFHLLFLNPPYLQLYGGARSEKRFLGESYDHLMMGGMLVYIIPYYRLTEDVCSFLAAHY